MIPELSDDTGHLPPGRYRTTLAEVHERFVLHPQFANSLTRRSIWSGFLNYVATWRGAEEAVDSDPILQSVWLAGSFASATQDPDDLDVTPVVDREALLSVQGRPGSKRLRKLIGHRSAVTAAFRVEPFVLEWVPAASTLRPTAVGSSVRDYLERRGALDDWWQRVRPDGPKQAPEVGHALPRRGYLEVTP